MNKPTTEITQKHLDAIIEFLADKTLSFGCLVLLDFTKQEFPFLNNPSEQAKPFVEKITNTYYDGENKYASTFSNHDFELIDGHWECTTDGVYLKQILGHPILKCHVEQRMSGKWELCPEEFQNFHYFWTQCGLDKSLQEIFKEAWENGKLKEPVEQLARFLIEIFNIEAK